MPHESRAEHILACPCAGHFLPPSARGIPGLQLRREPWESGLPLVERDPLCPPLPLFHPGHFTADCALLGGYPGMRGVCRGVAESALRPVE